MNNKINEIIEINDYIVSKLMDGLKDHIINDKKYIYLGKGGNGVIYQYEDKAIKIYTKYHKDSVFKEFYLVGLLQELNNINRNVIHIYGYYLTLEKPVMVMEIMDGDLSKWCHIMVHENLSKERYDAEWTSMIFQVVYGFTYLNKMNILHNDPKPKNILYKKRENIKFIEYQINNKKYRVPVSCTFKIADFGEVQIIGSTLNKMSDTKIIDNIRNRTDLYELSRLIYRLLIDYAKNYYTIGDLDRIASDNNDFNKYKNEQIEYINSNEQLNNLPRRIKDSFLLRSLLYYCIENGIIDRNNIISKASLHLPSKNIDHILDNLTNLKYENVFDLFDKFIYE